LGPGIPHLAGEHKNGQKCTHNAQKGPISAKSRASTFYRNYPFSGFMVQVVTSRSYNSQVCINYGYVCINYGYNTGEELEQRYRRNEFMRHELSMEMYQNVQQILRGTDRSGEPVVLWSNDEFDIAALKSLQILGINRGDSIVLRKDWRLEDWRSM